MRERELDEGQREKDEGVGRANGSGFATSLCKFYRWASIGRGCQHRLRGELGHRGDTSAGVREKG